MDQDQRPAYKISLKERVLAKITHVFYNFDAMLSFPMRRAFENLSGCDAQRYYCEKYFNFTVGKYSYGFIQFCKMGVNLASVGAFVSIAPDVIITGTNHPSEHLSTHPFLYRTKYGFIPKNLFLQRYHGQKKKVTIGNDVWIGQHVIILPAVTIHDGAIIGAGAVVTKDVPPYAIAVGCPAKVMKYRYDESTIQALLKIQWWAWDDKKIKENIDKFYNVSEFLASNGN